MQYKLNTIPLFCLICILGCSTSHSTSGPPEASGTPSLCTQPASFSDYKNDDDEVLYAQGSGTSRDLQVAISKATLNARSEIAYMISSELDAYRNQIVEEIETTDDPELKSRWDQRTEESSKLTLSNVETIEKSEPCREGDIFRAYVVVGIPRSTLKKNYQQTIEKDKKLHDLVKERPAYRDIFSDIDND